MDQVEKYIYREHHSNHAHYSLFAISAGTNDQILGRGQTLALDSVKRIEDAISRLTDAGGYAFLIVIPPSVTLSPRPPIDDTDWFNHFRRELTKLRIRLSSRERKLKCSLLDLSSVLGRLVERHDRFGFQQALQPCVVDGRICDEPDGYVWWQNVSARSGLDFQASE